MAYFFACMMPKVGIDDKKKRKKGGERGDNGRRMQRLIRE